MMAFISNGKKLHVSAYSGHLQVSDNFLAKRVLYNTPKPRGDVEISSSFYVLLTEFTSPYSLNTQWGWHTSDTWLYLICDMSIPLQVVPSGFCNC